MPTISYLSLGSNIGDRKAHLEHALARLDAIGRLVSVSSFYETEPVEFTRQEWFLNCAAALEVLITANELLHSLLAIEQQMGRHRTQNKGPRTIDIDILLFGDEVVNTPDLVIPHPAMAHRRFVLEPLAEIAPKVRHPLLHKTIVELLDEAPREQAVQKLPRVRGS